MAYSDELMHGIFGDVEYEAPAPRKKNFLPWHRPRKQFVRDHQWVKQIASLVQQSPPEGRVLKYLGLPGDDFLDIRYFHQKICEPHGVKIRFLGFNTSAGAKETDFLVSLDEIRKLELVDPMSEVLSDDFCRLSNDRSIAWRRACEFGPYDVINLDLCDGFALQQPGLIEENHYNAINRIMPLQARSKSPWLLFLTTRAGNGHVHRDVIQKFVEKYAQNLIDCEEFRKESICHLRIPGKEALECAIQNSSGLLYVFLVGLCKWLLGISLGQRPPTKVEVRSVIGYRVEAAAPHEDLISLAFRFEPTFHANDDEMGLAGQEEERVNECHLAAKALRRVVKLRNADKILQENIALQEEMVEATTKLLELARYDTSGFRDWLAQG